MTAISSISAAPKATEAPMPASLQLKPSDDVVWTTDTGYAECFAAVSAAPAAVMPGKFSYGFAIACERSPSTCSWYDGAVNDTGAGCPSRSTVGEACAVGTATAANVRPRAILLSLK